MGQNFDEAVHPNIHEPDIDEELSTEELVAMGVLKDSDLIDATVLFSTPLENEFDEKGAI